MAGSWRNEETQTLISIWGEESIQSKLDRVQCLRENISGNEQIWLRKELEAV